MKAYKDYRNLETYMVSEQQTPVGYALRLATYIKDPSTIRARTIEMFGRSPSKDIITGMIAGARPTKLRAVPKTFVCGHPHEPSNHASAADGGVRCATCERNRRAARKPEPTPRHLVAEPARIETAEEPEMDRVPIESLLTAAAKLAFMTVAEIKGDKRYDILVRVRRAVAYLSRREGYSFPHIARAMGKDHSSIIYANNCAKQAYGKDQLFTRLVQAIWEEVDA